MLGKIEAAVSLCGCTDSLSQAVKLHDPPTRTVCTYL